MKLSPLTQIKLAAVMAAVLAFLGCEAPNSAGEPPEQASPASAAPVPDNTPEAALAETPVAAPVAVTNADPQLIADSPAASVSSATNSAAPEAPKPPVPLSEKLEAVVKLFQSGVEDDVILAYIQNSPAAFSPTPEQVVYLTDVGLSDVVISALVNHQPPQVAASAPPAEAVPMAQAGAWPAVAQPGPAGEATYNPEPQVVYGNPPVVQYVSPPPVVEYNYFYTSLAPYGAWVEVADYGWCWQPSVAVSHHGWRPYGDRGHWLYTDCGWYWQSDYSWGWAPFHYGRWFNHPARGWCWRPDSVWAPAWVSWRYTDKHCGWAPLPPGSHYREGVGFTYYGAHVGAEFGFGLHRDAWTFVPSERFHDREVWRHRLQPTERAAAFRQSQVSNSYAMRNNLVINKGIEPNRIPALSRGEIRKIAIRDLPEKSSLPVRPDRLHQEGSQLVVYRPKPPTAVQEHNIRQLENPVTRSVPSRSGSPIAAGMANKVSVPESTTAAASPRTRTEPAAPSFPPRNQGARSWSPQGVASPPNKAVQPRSFAEVNPDSSPDPSRNVGIAPVRPVTPTQDFRPATPPANTSWNQVRSGSAPASPTLQRPFVGQGPGQRSGQVTPGFRQEPVRPPTPVAPERATPQVGTPYVRSAVPQAGSVSGQSGFSAPQNVRPAQNFSRGAIQTRPAPVAPSYTPAPVQARPAQPAQSFSAPASRPPPQAAPAPAPVNGGRRQY